LDPHLAVVISDASIKNQVATSISHIHSYNNPVIKTKHYVIRVTSLKAELFIIKYDINQTTYLSSLVSHHGTLTGKLNVKTFLNFGE